MAQGSCKVIDKCMGCDKDILEKEDHYTLHGVTLCTACLLPYRLGKIVIKKSTRQSTQNDY